MSSADGDHAARRPDTVDGPGRRGGGPGQTLTAHAATGRVRVRRLLTRLEIGDARFGDALDGYLVVAGQVGQERPGRPVLQPDRGGQGVAGTGGALAQPGAVE